MSIEKEKAVVSYLPSFSGDGYGYGGATILTIGDRSINLGEGHISAVMAREIAARWNAAEPKKHHEEEILF